jgi:hypothetical protein
MRRVDATSGVFECEHGCGFRGSFDEVGCHEEVSKGSCNFGYDNDDKRGGEGGRGGEGQEQEQEQEQEEEEEEEQEEVEDGWHDTVDGDGYTDTYCSLFKDFDSPAHAAIFAPLEVLRMFVTGWCIGVMVSDSQAQTQGASILVIHALQFVLELCLRPERALFATLLNSFTMLTDLLPLVITVMPTPEGCGPMPLGTQMVMLAAALLNTMMRIMHLLMHLLTFRVWRGVARPPSRGDLAAARWGGVLE